MSVRQNKKGVTGSVYYSHLQTFLFFILFFP